MCRMRRIMAVAARLLRLEISAPLAGCLLGEAGSQFVRVRYFQEWPGFAEARRHYNVHAVVLSPFLAARDARLANDPEWRAFIDNPAANGYATLPIPGLPDWKLLVSEPLRQRLNL